MKKLIFMLCLFIPVLPTFADEYNSVSLFSYSGYLTTPSAYITDGRLGFHYSYLPKYVAPFDKNRSENWIFSASLGFLPFMECYLSVYVAPQVHSSSEINYGAHKTRSAGVKIRIIDEGKRLPSFAVGIYDPEFKKMGANFSSNTVSSLFIVSSKRFDDDNISVSLGYGFDGLSGKYGRLKGLFCGLAVSVWKNMWLISDYDTEVWSVGVNTQWKGIDLLVATIHGYGPSYRIGYNFNLLD